MKSINRSESIISELPTQQPERNDHATVFNQRKLSVQSNTSNSSEGYYSADYDELSSGESDQLPSPPPSAKPSISSRRNRRSGVSVLNNPVGSKLTVEELHLNSMTWGPEDVAADSRQGLPKRYIDDFIAAADKRGHVLATRPVDALCKRPIEEGNPTKPFPIKGKSADWGLQQSFICVNQKYSKQHDADQATIDKYNKDVASVSSKHAVPAQLKISKARITELELINSDRIERSKTETDSSGNPNKIFFTVSTVSWTEYTQLAERNPVDGYWYIFNIIDGKKEPVEVLCHPDNQLPITADVDPLFEAFPREELDLGGKDRLPLPLISFKSVHKRIEKYNRRISQRRSSVTAPVSRKEKLLEQRRDTHIAKIRRESQPGQFLQAEIEDIGNVSPRTQEMIKHYGQSSVSAINRANPLVHHNIDSTSPFSDINQNFPATIYFPREVIESIPEFKRKGEQVVTVYNKVQLRLIIQLLCDHDFFMFINPMWEGLTDIRPKWFTENRIALNNQMPILRKRLKELQSESDKGQRKPITSRKLRKNGVWEMPAESLNDSRFIKATSHVGSMIRKFEKFPISEIKPLQ